MQTYATYIDLRSDTITLPTNEMRKAMAEAEVGDDVYGEDPTINKLEKLAAKKVNKEKALFVPSGAFGNLAAQMSHCTPGHEILLLENSHIMQNECGGSAFLAGLQTRSIPMETVCTVNVNEIRKRIRTPDIHHPDTGLICLENALGNGSIMPIENMKEIKSLAKEHRIPIHLDGARVFNAALSLGVPVTEITDQVDSVMFCLSKGLSAPVGSILAGSEAFIEKAKKIRKMLGGGMRQLGVLGAAGIIAIEDMVDRLAEDNENATWLAEKISDMPNVIVRKDQNQINMVFFSLAKTNITNNELAKKLKEEHILINTSGEDGTEEDIRFVTNRGTSRTDLEKVVSIMKKVIT